MRSDHFLFTSDMVGLSKLRALMAAATCFLTFPFLTNLCFTVRDISLHTSVLCHFCKDNLWVLVEVCLWFRNMRTIRSGIYKNWTLAGVRSFSYMNMCRECEFSAEFYKWGPILVKLFFSSFCIINLITVITVPLMICWKCCFLPLSFQTWNQCQTLVANLTLSIL